MLYYLRNTKSGTFWQGGGFRGTRKKADKPRLFRTPAALWVSFRGNWRLSYEFLAGWEEKNPAPPSPNGISNRSRGYWDWCHTRSEARLAYIKTLPDSLTQLKSLVKEGWQLFEVDEIPAGRKIS